MKRILLTAITLIVTTWPSEAAAMGSKFTAPVVESDKVHMSGLISYKFADKENVEITLESMKVELTPELRRKLTKKYKLQFWIFALVDRLDKGSDEPTEYESRFVTDGVTDVRELLNDGVQNGEEILKKAGLKIYRSNGRLVYGRIRVKKLYSLAELEAVKYVTP